MLPSASTEQKKLNNSTQLEILRTKDNEKRKPLMRETKDDTISRLRINRKGKQATT